MNNSISNLTAFPPVMVVLSPNSKAKTEPSSAAEVLEGNSKAKTEPSPEMCVLEGNAQVLNQGRRALCYEKLLFLSKSFFSEIPLTSCATDKDGYFSVKISHEHLQSGRLVVVSNGEASPVEVEEFLNPNHRDPGERTEGKVRYRASCISLTPISPDSSSDDSLKSFSTTLNFYKIKA